MSVPKWRRSGSKLDAFYEAVKLRHIVTQMIMRSYGMKTKHKSLIPDRLRGELFDDVNKGKMKLKPQVKEILIALECEDMAQ